MICLRCEGCVLWSNLLNWTLNCFCWKSKCEIILWIKWLFMYQWAWFSCPVPRNNTHYLYLYCDIIAYDCTTIFENWSEAQTKPLVGDYCTLISYMYIYSLMSSTGFAKLQTNAWNWRQIGTRSRSSHLYLYSAFNNADRVKAALQYQIGIVCQ